MRPGNSTLIYLLFPVVLGWLSACSDSSSDHRTSESAALLAQFGDCASMFSEAGMQGLLDFEDASSPVTLLQIMSVSDAVGFARYESEMADVLGLVSAEVKFASRIVAQLIGERAMTEVRVIEFPNIMVLIDGLQSAEFASAMDTLCAATSDHAWTMGRPDQIPFEFTDPYPDPELQNINRDEAIALLAASIEGEPDPETSLVADQEVIVDMIVSDSPEPFYMVNLIDFYELAKYSDGRESGLTGLEVNEIYGQSIFPFLIKYKSGPELLMNVDVVLTQESAGWEQAAIVRYASRDAFLRIFPLNPDAGDSVIHKEASVENTLVYVSEERHFAPPEPVNGFLYNQRYCEILLATLGAGISVEVYGTQGLNLCPQDQWDAIDRSSVASDFGVTAAFFNGPRFFVVDWTSNIEGLAGGDRVFFGDLEMQLLTTVVPAAGAASGESAYKTNQVARDNVWHFVAGRRIYQLEDPDGQRYIMQAFSQIVDPDLQLSDLAFLGERLVLPPGWSFSSHVLLESFDLPAIDGVAEVIQDELANTYQRVP